MLRILILLVVSALLALADGPVLQTGQTKSYDGDGNVVTYSSIKDDGYFRAGKAQLYFKKDVIEWFMTARDRNEMIEFDLKVML